MNAVFNYITTLGKTWLTGGPPEKFISVGHSWTPTSAIEDAYRNLKNK